MFSPWEEGMLPSKTKGLHYSVTEGCIPKMVENKNNHFYLTFVDKKV